MPALSQQFQFVFTSTNSATSVAIPYTQSYTRLLSIDGNNIFKSQREKGDGYYGSSDGFHTVSYTITPNFQGTLTTQATLATSPIEADWFDVTSSSVEYKNLINPVASTTTAYVNFTGNFVWVRAKVHRSADDPNGSVMWINYNH